MARWKVEDFHRAVLMLITEQHPELRWADVAEVFNNIFHTETRTQHSLNQQWYLRNTTRRAVWETARENISPQEVARYTNDINNAVTNLSNPSQARVTKQSERVLKWDRGTRLGLHLLMEDGSLAMKDRVAIFSALFRDVLRLRNIRPMSAGSLQHQYRQRKDADELNESEIETGVEAQDHPAKRRKDNSKKTTAQEYWNFILHGPETEKLEMMARVKEFTEKYRTSSRHDAELPGHHRFRTWEDGNQAAINLGEQFDGLPAYPSANEVAQWVIQRPEAGQSIEHANGIRIVRIPTAENEAPRYNGPQHGSTGVAMDNDGQAEHSEHSESPGSESDT